MQTLINMIVFLLVIGSIITIHELGHFIAAKFFGVYCAQFSIGFGPVLFSKKGKETEYELRALPFGGFVAMAGEDDQENNELMKDVPIERTLKGKKTYQKVIIFLAGVFMNFVLALVVLLGVNLTSGKVAVNKAIIGSVSPHSIAEQYGLKEGDLIKKIQIEQSNQTFLISQFKDVELSRKTIHSDKDSLTMNITLLRNEKEEVLKLNVPYNENSESYLLGISPMTRRMSVVEAISYSFITFRQLSLSIFEALSLLVTRFSDTVGQLSGPAGIYQVTAEVTQSGHISYIFNLVALLSVNIGIFNLLPIPGLDGCQVLFAVVERIIGRELPQRLKLVLQVAGLGLVMLLMVYVTYHDILRIIG